MQCAPALLRSIANNDQTPSPLSCPHAHTKSRTVAEMRASYRFVRKTELHITSLHCPPSISLYAAAADKASHLSVDTNGPQSRLGFIIVDGDIADWRTGKSQTFAWHLPPTQNPRSSGDNRVEADRMMLSPCVAYITALCWPADNVLAATMSTCHANGRCDKRRVRSLCTPT